MKLDGWLVVQSFLLPDSRERLPVLLRCLTDPDKTKAAQIMREQIVKLERTIKRKVQITKDEYVELVLFLINHRTPLKARVDTLIKRP